ncbi:CD99 molecule isoform X4 [Pseudochaenichthys georgianus]|uniref:CD99 molecule isoform X4 n=1 Tax=Pseudochaenichthys georgianus TaxID=52239 RepID=UPI001469A510|nr:CD99 molecule isoform X4 [Pseudochaenichthys georgianus]
MRLCLRIVSLLFVVTGTLTQDGFNLLDALDEVPPTPAKPKEEPKAPEDPISDDGLSLSDAFGPAEPMPTPKPTKKPSSGDAGGGGGFDLGDALGPDPNPKPDTPVVNPPPSGGGGGTFDINDLADAGGDGYKPDEGPGGGGGYESNDGAEEPQDPDLLWGHILKMLNANMPEEFYMWMSNLKQVLAPLLERAMNLLQVIP